MHEHHHQPPHGRLPNTLDTAPNLELIRLQYSDRTVDGKLVHGATFNGFYSRVDAIVLTESGAPQSRGEYYRWAPIRHTTH